MGAVDKAVMWPQYVKDRVKDTYMYFGGSLFATAGTAAAVFRSPTAMNLVSRGGLMAMGVSIAAMIGSSMVALSTVAVCAPSDKFLYMGGPLAMGLGLVFCASI